MRKNVEQTAIRMVLLMWAAVAVLVAVSGQEDGRLAARVAAVLLAGIVTVEGARGLHAASGPPGRPLAPLVRLERHEPTPVPARLQSWIGLVHAADGDPHVGPLLHDRLADLARARGSTVSLAPGTALDHRTLDRVLAELERTPWSP